MEENKDIKIIRKAATELKLPLWRDALDEYISRFAAESWSVQHLMAIMMQDQLKMRADNRRRTLIKRATFRNSNIWATSLSTNSPMTHAPLCHCCGRSTSSGKDETSSCTAILEQAKRTLPLLWVSKPALRA